MCGIVGVVGLITANEEKVFKQLLEVDSLRGRHSTGVIKLSSGGVVETRKKAIDGMDFVKLEGNWISSGVNRMLIGHNRYATRGGVNDANAHPFSHGHIHGVHNGTLTTQLGLKDQHKFPVDSDNLFYDMAHGSLRETAKKISGAWTVAMYDEQEKTFNMFRNTERPMSVALSEDGTVMYFASEATMLEWVLDRNGVKYRDILNLTPAKLITIEPTAVANADGKRVPDLMSITDIEYKKVPAAPARGAKKFLSDFGLNIQKKYPISLINRNKTNAGYEYEVELMVPPYNSWTVYAYQHKTAEVLGKLYDNDEIACSVLTIGYNSNMPHCWGMDIEPATEEALKILADEEAAAAAAVIDQNDVDDLTEDELSQIFDAYGITQIKKEWYDHNGLTMTEAEFDKTQAGQHGCCMCGDHFQEPEDVVWNDDGDTAFCTDCVEAYNAIYGTQAQAK